LSLADTFIGTVLGGFIAGIVGVLTARYERSQRRKEAHLREHKKNFNAIQESLDSLKSQVWPLTAKGAENLALPRWSKPQHTQLRSYSIKDYQRFQPVSGNAFNTGFEIIDIDDVLYSDIPKHFSDIAHRLDEIERMVQTEGVRLDQLTYEVSAAVYKSMASSELSVLKWTFDQDKSALLREIASSDTNESQGYAGYLFLMVIGEDPANWPMGYAGLEKYGLVGGLKGVADKIKIENEPKVSEMLQLKKRIFTRIDGCNETMELQKHKSSIKGKCEYL
jgi:gas vesicle protein